MHKRFLHGKVIAAQICAFAVMIFVSSNFSLNDRSITNANAAVAGASTLRVAPKRFTSQIARRVVVTPTLTPTQVPTRVPTLQPTVVPSSTPIPPTSAPASNTLSNLSGLESQTVTLINDERKRKGLGELGADAALTAAARRHAKDMCEKSNFSHTGTDGSNFSIRAQDAGYGGFASGEVIGWNHTSAESIFNGWMGSPPHHDIIMGSGITKIGIGWSGNCVVGVVGS